MPGWGGRPAGSALREQSGFTLVELLISMLVLLLALIPIFDSLVIGRQTENRDANYADELQTADVAMTRLIHDVREASSFQTVTPGLLKFQVTQNGTLYNVSYDCTASDSMGAPYTRCARTQAVAPTPAPAATSAVSDLDIQHVYNNPTNTTGGNEFATYCNATGTGLSGSIFFPENGNTANTDGGGLACDEAYEDLVAALPTYVQIRLMLPANGGQTTQGGYQHLIVLKGGAYIPNSDSGS